MISSSPLINKKLSTREPQLSDKVPNRTSPRNCVKWLTLALIASQDCLKWTNHTVKGSTSEPNATTWKTCSKTTSTPTRTSPARPHNAMLKFKKLKVGSNTTILAKSSLTPEDSKSRMTALSKTSPARAHTTQPSAIWTTVEAWTAPGGSYCPEICLLGPRGSTRRTRAQECPEKECQVRGIRMKSSEQRLLVMGNTHWVDTKIQGWGHLAKQLGILWELEVRLLDQVRTIHATVLISMKVSGLRWASD